MAEVFARSPNQIFNIGLMIGGLGEVNKEPRQMTGAPKIALCMVFRVTMAGA